MNKELFYLFRKTINNNKCRLERDNRKWQLSENDITIEFQAPNRNSFGFSLDTGNVKDIFGFFSDNKLPECVAKMCDGIIVLKHKEKDYIFLIEQKTNNKDEYKKQLINGWHFCQWLLGLFKEHNHYDGNIGYIGLLYRNRKTPTKATSTHSTPEVKPMENGIKFFETNQITTYLQPYIKAIENSC